MCSSSIGKFYVYVHAKKDTGRPFYVGKGMGRRYLVRSGRNAHWVRTEKKHGMIPFIVYRTNIESDALKMESRIIKNLRRYGEKLCNYTDGGDGGDCFRHNAATKMKFRMAKLGKKQSPEHAKKSAEAKIGKKQPRDAVEKTRKARSRMIISSNGEVFSSSSEAARVISKRGGICCSQGNISQCARGQRNNAYGVTWSYDLSSAPEFRETNFGRMRIINIDNGMEFASALKVIEWLSSEKPNKYKYSRQQISRACSTGGKSYGYRWKYA